MLGEENHGIAQTDDEVVDLRARSQREDRELTGAVIDVDTRIGTRDDLHDRGRGIHGHQDGRAGITEAGVHGFRGLAAPRQGPDVDRELRSTDVT